MALMCSCSSKTQCLEHLHGFQRSPCQLDGVGDIEHKILMYCLIYDQLIGKGVPTGYGLN